MAKKRRFFATNERLEDIDAVYDLQDMPIVDRKKEAKQGAIDGIRDLYFNPTDPSVKPAKFFVYGLSIEDEVDISDAL